MAPGSPNFFIADGRSHYQANYAYRRPSIAQKSMSIRKNVADQGFGFRDSVDISL